MKNRKKWLCWMLAIVCVMLTACGSHQEEPPPEPIQPAVITPDANGMMTWGGQTFSIEEESLFLNLQIRSNEILDLSPLLWCIQLRQLNIHVTVTPHVYQDKYGDKHLMEFTPTDLTPLSALDNLERLELNVGTINSLAPLAHLSNLSTLVLWLDGEIDLSPLTSCTNLESLALGGRTNVDLTPLQDCPSLRSLRVDVYDSNWNTPDLSVLSGAPCLQELCIGGSNGLGALVDVPLTHLVDLNDSADILENLPMLNTLTTVEFSDEHLQDIQPLLLHPSVTEIVLEVGAQEIERGTVVTDPDDPVLDRLVTAIPVAQLRSFLMGETSITLNVNQNRTAGTVE